MANRKTFSVSVSYPPIYKNKQTAFLSQNRQFQWTNTNNIIFPVIPAYAATLLQSKGYQVFWDDAIAEKLNYQQWLTRLIKNQPDLIAIETKTPVVKKHWKIIDQIKKKLPKSTIVLMGDHVTAIPKESLKHSQVDFILTGGDYDFMLLNLANHLHQKEKLQPGFYFHQKNKIINSGKFVLKHHQLDKLPIIDRQLTKNHLYTHRNSNFKYKPGAYIMSARDCWWGKCSFCSWTTLFPCQQYRRFSPQYSIKEIQNLVNNFNIKEIFDDSGTLPTGDWLNNFSHLLIKQKLNKKISLGANLRMASLSQSEFNLIKKAGFRFLLFGLESANQKTLDKINKNIKVCDIKKTLIESKKAGLVNHITTMIGYPWENLSNYQETINLIYKLFRQGLTDSIQATLLIPYPGTPLFEQLKREKLLLTQDWNKYDMSQPVIKSPLSTKQQKQIIQTFFKGALQPQFLFKQIVSIHSLSDFVHLANYSLKFLLKLKDF
ncbi:B12-binding domain-containing radical SAM protein [Candidatus Shapirobacteria bacterium]|nr:MAG: B12-binding domain-containing radical SAM protein [Candidatus Shapirobacteria bacterium]